MLKMLTYNPNRKKSYAFIQLIKFLTPVTDSCEGPPNCLTAGCAFRRETLVLWPPLLVGRYRMLSVIRNYMSSFPSDHQVTEKWGAGSATGAGTTETVPTESYSHIIQIRSDPGPRPIQMYSNLQHRHYQHLLLTLPSLLTLSTKSCFSAKWNDI